LEVCVFPDILGKVKLIPAKQGVEDAVENDRSWRTPNSSCSIERKGVNQMEGFPEGKGFLHK